jgi:glycosyltransferase involved in cell wall biosynthesis
MPKLSLCIATFKRGKFIAETLESILSQVDSELEVVVVDGASPDETQEIVSRFAEKYPSLRYYREETNSGVDADYDKAVGYSTGDYCWLFPDDDLLAPGAMERLVSVIDTAPDLIVANSEIWNADFTRSLHTRMLRVSEDREYGAADRDEAFVKLATSMSFIGSLIIKRSVWLARDRASYYGSLYGHVGVVFQEPPLERIAVIADPLLRIRYGNSMWSPRSFEVLYFKWPAMVWSFPHIAEGARRRVVLREPWRRFRSLFKSRALGEYSRTEFRRFLAGRPLDLHVVQAALISVFPAGIANVLWVAYYATFQRTALFTLFDLLRSRHSSAFSRTVAALAGIKIL